MISAGSQNKCIRCIWWLMTKPNDLVIYFLSKFNLTIILFDLLWFYIKNMVVVDILIV